MKPLELVRQAKEQVGEITGLDVEGTTALRRDGDGWIITVVALELARTPNTMDVLGAYEVTLSDDGELQSFERTRRFHRSETEQDGR